MPEATSAMLPLGTKAPQFWLSDPHGKLVSTEIGDLRFQRPAGAGGLSHHRRHQHDEFQCPAALLLLHIQLRKLLVKMLHLGQIVDHDVQVFGVIVGVILVVILRGIKCIERNNLSGDGPRKYLGLI